MFLSLGAEWLDVAQQFLPGNAEQLSLSLTAVSPKGAARAAQA